MNARVRTYLIEAARESKRVVYYSDVVKDCDLDIDISSEAGRKKLSEVLGEVSAYENSQVPARPLLSSLAIYKDKARNDHGDGFYKVAEKLGKGSFKQLKDSLYGFSEAEECKRFWRNDDNYRKFASLTTDAGIADGGYFKQEELLFFKQWQYRSYDPKDAEHVAAKTYLMDTVWDKTIKLGKEVVKRLEGFQLEGGKYWSQRGWKEREDGSNVQAAIVKPYTWVKIFKDADKGKDIFFTFGLDASAAREAFIYKIDCQETRDSKLLPSQVELCRSLIPDEAERNTISFEELVNTSLADLISICVGFIEAYTNHYDEIVMAAWGHTVQPSLFKNRLVKKEKPTDGYDTMPASQPSFTGVDIDYVEKGKEQKDLGDRGEGLVLQREVAFLKRHNLHDKAALVGIVKDGEGYDVYSFDEQGNEKYIEVKTTTGNEYTPFYLTHNELAFMRLHAKQYAIYRLYQYNADNNFAEFYELTGDIESQVLMAPTQFKVLIKKEVAI